MKITDAYNVSMVAAQKVRRRRRADGVEEPERVAPASDQVSFSGRGMDVRKARVLALQAPEIRVGLVDSISDKIRNGEYQVTGSDVAPKLIQDHLVLVRA